MIFSSYWFIFVFFPLVFVVNVFLNKFISSKASQIFLIAASIVFFTINSGWFVLVFMGSVLLNYFISQVIIKIPDNRKHLRLAFLVMGIFENIALLSYYKYSNFAIRTFNSLFSKDIPLLDVVLPIGISFFTFQIIAYLVDCYKDKTDTYTLVEYLLFITLFFQLIIGPITRHKEIIPQFRDGCYTKVNPANLQRGFFVFSIGLGQKVLLADTLIPFTRSLFNNVENLSPLMCLIALFANLFAYYFDFAGYTNMAIGVARCFNIVLPENLNSPLKARNFQDYWQRRHITLTKFFTEFVFRYVYNPSRGVISFAFATMITFLVSGLWHGAGWNFVLWGVLQGILVCMAAVTAVYSAKRYFIPKHLAQILTVTGLLLVGGLFMADNISHYFMILRKLTDFSHYATSNSSVMDELLVFATQNAYALMIICVCFYISFFTKNSAEMAKKCSEHYIYPIFAGLIFTLSLFMLGKTSEFLYYRF